MAELVQGKILEAGDEGEGERKFVVILTENDKEYRIQSKFTNDAPTLRLLGDPDKIIGGVGKVRFTSNSKMSADGEMKTYLNLQSLELVTPPDDMPEQPIEGRVQSSSLMMGGKDALIVDQVLLKAAVELMNGPRDMNKDEATETVIGLWDQIRGRHLPKVEEEVEAE